MNNSFIIKKYNGDIEDDADVCIIGTGAGGSVVANHLTHENKKVIMLERGNSYSMEELENECHEKNLMNLYNFRGAFLTRQLSATIAQGNCVGGSTMINYGICMQIPPTIFSYWRNNCEVKITKDELNKAYSEIESMYNVIDLSDEGKFHEKIQDGCKILGWSHGWMKKAIKNGKKQNSLVAFLEKSNLRKLTIYSNCTAQKFEKDGNTIKSIKAKSKNGESEYDVKITAKKFVLAAGTIWSSQLLLFNKIGNENKKVGQDVSIHPSMSVIGVFDQRINAQDDSVMAYYCDHFSALKQPKPGHMIESAFVAPSQFSLVVPGYGEENLKNVKKHYDYVSMAGVLVHDEAVGKISLNSKNDPQLDYSLSENDKKEMVLGLQNAALIFFKAGAKKVITGHIVPIELDDASQIYKKITLDTVQQGKILLVSAHPQGGNKMGDKPESSVVNSYCKSHSVSNLYICDASVFPTSIGVNPQLTVMAIAKIAAKHIFD